MILITFLFISISTACYGQQLTVFSPSHFMLILFSDSHTVLRCLPCALPCSVIVNGNQFLMDGSQVDLGTTLKKAVIIGNVITVSQCFSLCDRKLNLTG